MASGSSDGFVWRNISTRSSLMVVFFSNSKIHPTWVGRRMIIVFIGSNEFNDRY